METTFIPEIVAAYRCGDQVHLRSVVDGRACSAMFATFRERDVNKIEWDPRVLDIHGIDVVKAGIDRDNDEPYIVITFVAQHVGVQYHNVTVEDPITKEKSSVRTVIDPTKESEIQNVYYSWMLVRDYESDKYNWKITEFQAQTVYQLV